MTKFDAMGLDVDEPRRMTLIHPKNGQAIVDEDGNEAWIDLLSSDSEVGIKYERTLRNKRLAMRAGARVSAEQLEGEDIGLLVELTDGWNLISPDGRKLDVAFTKEDVRELYSHNRNLWIVEQVRAFVYSRANFSPASSES